MTNFEEHSFEATTTGLLSLSVIGIPGGTKTQRRDGHVRVELRLVVAMLAHAVPAVGVAVHKDKVVRVTGGRLHVRLDLPERRRPLLRLEREARVFVHDALVAVADVAPGDVVKLAKQLDPRRLGAEVLYLLLQGAEQPAGLCGRNLMMNCCMMNDYQTNLSN